MKDDQAPIPMTLLISMSPVDTEESQIIIRFLNFRKCLYV